MKTIVLTLACVFASGCSRHEFFVVVPKNTDEISAATKRESHNEQVSTTKEVIWSWVLHRESYDLYYEISDRPLLPNVRITVRNPLVGGIITFDESCSSWWLSCASIEDNALQCSAASTEFDDHGQLCLGVSVGELGHLHREVFEFNVEKAGTMIVLDGP